jgi:hypothetical protein
MRHLPLRYHSHRPNPPDQESLNPVHPIYSEKSDLFALGCTMYELCNLQPAYNGTARHTVPDMKPTARLEYGGRISPLLANLMGLSPSGRMSTRALVKALETYCASRFEKQKAVALWQNLTVMAPAQGVGPPGREKKGRRGHKPR